MTKTTRKTRPKAPEELEGEGLLAWQRLVERLELAGTLETTDPDLMLMWCDLWEVYSDARREVKKSGFASKHNNGTTGRSTAFQVMKDMAAALRRLARDLGLTAKGANAGDMDDLEI